MVAELPELEERLSEAREYSAEILEKSRLVLQDCLNGFELMSAER